jgi:glycosyltransferase involved in cell wall biosynthesis
MYTDLANEFFKNGHNVHVAAPTTLNTEVHNESGILVLRIKTLTLFKTDKIRKGIANLLLPYQYKRAISHHFKDISFDLLITPTPPITFVLTLKYLKKRYGSTVYLILRDIFPQNAKDLGLIRNSIIFNFFRKKEKKLYQLADAIGCMSPKNIEFVRNHNPEVNLSKLHLLPNWTNVTEYGVIGRDIKLKYNLDNKFIAVFAGNFGIPQKMEFLIEVAELIRERKEILFLFVGDGTEKNMIRKLIKDKNLENIQIIDQLSKQAYLELLHECDVGIVSLSDKFTIPNIPSRTLSYWSLKIPVLAAIDKNTDYGDLLKISNGGLWSVTGDTESFINNLFYFYNNPEIRKKMGENGHHYLINELNAEKAYKIILSRI